MNSKRFPDEMMQYALKGISPREMLYLQELTVCNVNESRTQITNLQFSAFFSKKVSTLFPFSGEKILASVSNIWVRESSVPIFLLVIAIDKDSVSPDEYRTKISPSSAFCTSDVIFLWIEIFLTLFKSLVFSSQQRMKRPKTPTYCLLFGLYNTFDENLSNEVQLLICF